MQTKTKLKSKKTSQILSNEYSNKTEVQSKQYLNEFVEVGGICGDGTFTSNTGRGAGSHHNGIKHKVYARRSQLYPSQKQLIFHASLSSSKIQSKFEQTNPKQINILLSQKKKLKKISLKDDFKTKTKKSALYEKVHLIFDTLYKDELQFIEEQLNDQLWLIISAICNLYDELEDSNNLIKALQKSQQSNLVKKSSPKEQTNIEFVNIKSLQLQVQNLQKENQYLTRQIQKLIKSSNQFSTSLQEQKSKQKNFKKMLKVIEKQNPKIVTKALEQSKINIKDLKREKKVQNRVITRSMLKKQESKKEEKQFESLFSSDSSDFYDQDHTIVSLIKSMK